MYHMSVEDLECLINSLEYTLDNLVIEGAIESPFFNLDRRINEIILLLNEIQSNAKSISLFSGEFPKISLSDDIANNISCIKNLLEASNG